MVAFRIFWGMQRGRNVHKRRRDLLWHSKADTRIVSFDDESWAWYLEDVDSLADALGRGREGLEALHRWMNS